MKKRSKNTTALAISMIIGITAICGIMSQGIEASAQADYVVRDEKITYRGHTYAFMDAGEYRLNSYREVEDFCRSMGGHLAVINDNDENGFLFETLQNSFSTTAFFGYSDHEQESVWVWSDQTSAYENWTNYGKWDQPDNGIEYGGDEDYAEFNYERGKSILPNDGTWNDAPFRQNTDIFICEWEYEEEQDDPFTRLTEMESVINAVLFACDLEGLDTLEPSVNNNEFFWDTMCTYCNSYPVTREIGAMNYPRYGEDGNYQGVPNYVLRNAAYAMFSDFDGSFPELGDNTDRAIAVDDECYGIAIADSISFVTLRSWKLLDDGSIGAVYYTAYEDGTPTGSYEVDMKPNPNYHKEGGPETYYYTIVGITKFY